MEGRGERRVRKAKDEAEREREKVKVNDREAYTCESTNTLK